MDTDKRPTVSLPHAYPFRFVDTILESPGPRPPEESNWRGTALSRVSINGRAAMGGAWASPLLLAEAIAQAALALEGGDPEVGRRGFLAGIEGFEATRPALAGETLSIRVRLVAQFGAIARFEGEVHSGDEIIARGAVLVKRGDRS